jgi:hypothetical protein
MVKEKGNQVSRRDFVKLSATSLAGRSILPSKVIAGLGHPAPSDKLNIAVVGIGGVGFRNLNHLKDVYIVAYALLIGLMAKIFRTLERCPAVPRLQVKLIRKRVSTQWLLPPRSYPFGDCYGSNATTKTCICPTPNGPLCLRSP